MTGKMSKKFTGQKDKNSHSCLMLSQQIYKSSNCFNEVYSIFYLILCKCPGSMSQHTSLTALLIALGGQNQFQQSTLQLLNSLIAPINSFILPLLHMYSNNSCMVKDYTILYIINDKLYMIN